MASEFATGDIVSCIGSSEKWVVQKVEPTIYVVKRVCQFLEDDIADGDFASLSGDVSKVVAHSDFVKVGRWNFKSRKEETDDAQ